MYKVLLVDDEYMITEGLKKLIPFDHWNMEVVATAEDADQIMEWIRHLKVSQETKLLLQKPLDKKTLNPLNRQTIAYNLFDGKETALLLEAERDTKQGMKKVKAKIRAAVGVEDEILVEECRRALMGAIFRNLHNGELRQRYAKVEQEGRIL